MHLLERTTHSTSLKGRRPNDILDAQHVSPVPHPVERHVAQHKHEPHERHHVRDARACRIGNRALDRREHRAARNAHDEDPGPAARVPAQVGRAEREERRVHGRLEEEEHDEDGDGRRAVARADVCIQGDCENGVDHEQEVGLEDCREGCGDEAADCEGDEGV